MCIRDRPAEILNPRNAWTDKAAYDQMAAELRGRFVKTVSYTHLDVYKRQMQIIEALEPTRRGIYGGSVLYADFAGNLDSCIAIRTMLMQGRKAYLQAGAGIVADSDPGREFQESINKAQAVLRAVAAARSAG